MKVGVIGVGYWGKKHVDEYSSLLHDVFVSDMDEKKLEFCKTKFGAKPVNDYHEILDNEEIKIVSICTPNHTHYELAVEALNAGKNILVEKPMAMNTEDAKAIIQLADEKKLNLLVGHIFRFNNAIDKAKQIIRNNEIGKVYTVSLRWLTLEPVFQDREILFDLGVHPIDIIDNIFEGIASNIFCSTRGFRQKNAEYATINYSLTSPFSEGRILVNVELSWLDPMRERTLRIIGSKKSLEVDCVGQKVSIVDNDSREITNIENQPNNTIRDELEFFIESVTHKKNIMEPSPNGTVAKRVLEILERVKNSSHDQR